jgi:hypothetical protein
MIGGIIQEGGAALLIESLSRKLYMPGYVRAASAQRRLKYVDAMQNAMVNTFF